MGSLISIGTNTKLGERVGSYSRPVGPSCPASCPFLSGKVDGGPDIPAKLRCYAEKVQNRYTSVREKWASESYGLSTRDWNAWIVRMVAEIKRAHAKARAIRIHVGGDFVRDGKLDRPYIAATLVAYRRARRMGFTVPTWFYTHVWRDLAPYVKLFDKVGIKCYASVHTAMEANEATKLGFLLAIDPGEEMPDNVPAFVQVHGARAIVCPEMRKKGKVTCTECMYCPKGLGNVVFYRHR